LRVTALSRRGRGERRERALERALRAEAPVAIGPEGWNATHTTAEVLAAFDKAIAAEEAKA
jgi:hypothetical protein